MNSCNIELKRHIISSIKDNKNRGIENPRNTAINNIANEISKASNGVITVNTSIKQLNDLLREQNHVTDHPQKSIINYFKLNGIYKPDIYQKVKDHCRNIIIDSIFNNSTLISTDNSLDLKIRSLQNNARRYLGVNHSPINLYAKWVQNNTNDGKEKMFNLPNNIEYISNLLLAVCPELIIQAWIPDLISYNINNETFSFNVDSHVRKDWSEEDSEKETELNSLLDTLCQITPMEEFYDTGEIKQVRSIPTRYLNRNAFFYSVIQEFKNMTDDQYKEILDNPYKFIDYIINKYKEKGNSSELYENIMHSFVYKWIYNPNTNEERPLVKNSIKNNNKAIGYNPLDIIIRNVNKYVEQRYYEYDTKGLNVTLGLVEGEYAAEYNRISENVTSILQSNINVNLEPHTDAEIKETIRLLTGTYISINDRNRSTYTDFIQLVKKYKNKNNGNTFQDFIKDQESDTFTVNSFIKNNTAFNPYSIKGSIQNKESKRVPTIGLSTLAGSLKENLLRNELRLEEQTKEYELAQANNPNITIPVSPIQHSFLYKFRHNNTLKGRGVNHLPIDNLFKGVVYRTTISDSTTGIVKNIKNISVPEATKLMIFSDFLNGWETDSIIRIQSITPSDKPKIPYFEFDVKALKDKYGKTNSEIEFNIRKEISNIYNQVLLNTMKAFSNVFGWKWTEIDVNDTNAIIDRAEKINIWLINHGITEQKLNDALYDFNQKNNLNLNLAKIKDFEKSGNSIIISKYLIEACQAYDVNSSKWNDLFMVSLEDMATYGQLQEAKNLLTKFKETNDINSIKDSNLYTFHCIQQVLSENILINTVGLPLAHKHSGDDFFKMDSSAHVTMVKRMVAQTATMHPCLHNSLNGLSNKTRTMVVTNDSAKVFVYSGNVTKGKKSEDDLDVADGAMFSCGFVEILTKQSMADTKPKSIASKYFLHSYDSLNGDCTLYKMANSTINNTILRMFSNSNTEVFQNSKYGNTNPINPEWFMQLSLRDAKFENVSIKNGKLVDYNGKVISITSYKNIDDVIYKISNLKFNNNQFIVTETNTSTGESKEVTFDNNLYAFWKHALGGQYSCDSDGNYTEKSQQQLAQVINSIGRINNSQTTDIKSQKDVDQYLKSKIVTYFCTDSGNKSVKHPLVDVRKAIHDSAYKANSVYLYIDNFGIQQDPDHTADNSQIKEITQLISFITEHGYVPDRVNPIYNGLANLLEIMASHTFVDLSQINDPDIAKEARTRLDNLFAEKLSYVMTNPNTDVMGMANSIIDSINELTNTLKVPYSDHQILGKIHTTVGSYLNDFISRHWTGRGDVLIPSHNMFMVYEDDQGLVHLGNDYYYENNHKIPIKQWLHDKVWYGQALRQDYIDTHTIKQYEVSQGDVYYRLSPNDGITVEVVDNFDKLNIISNDIKTGQARYIKAIDLPRNLRSKRVYLDIKTSALDSTGNIIESTERVNLYYLPIWQQLFEYGKVQDPRKADIQKEIETIVLPAIYEKNIDILRQYLPNEFRNSVVSFEYICYHPERATTNNYGSKFGINNMNFSEISQRKEAYFREKLEEKFDQPEDNGTKCDAIFYTSSGNPTYVIQADPNSQINSEWLEVQPIINENGYRINNDGDELYKLSRNDKIYVDQDGKEIVYTNNIDKFSQNDYFVLYSSDLNFDRKNLYNIKEESNKNIILNTLAKAQYESWLKSNISIQSRIPSQSLSFAMAIDTVAYLPFNNNITFVPNEQVLLHGSDFDIDKAFSIMAAIGNNGIYISNSRGILNIVDSSDNLTDLDIQINELIAHTILNKQDLYTVANEIKNIIKDNDITISLNLIYGLMIDMAQNTDSYGLTLSLDINTISNQIKKYIDQINMIMFSLNGLQTSTSGASKSLQNYIFENIQGVYDDPRTLIGANNPTTMDDVNDVVDNLDLEKSNRNHLNSMTNILLNQTTSVGKDDIAITATAQKAFYALTYYNDLLYRENRSVFNPTFITLSQINSNTNVVYCSLGFNGSRVNQSTLDDIEQYVINNLKDVSDKFNINNTNVYQYPNSNLYFTITTEDTGKKFIRYGNIDPSKFKLDQLALIEKNGYIGTFIPTTVNSAFISSSTDNAKEMKMDLLNATPEVVPAYEYCLSIGITPTQAARILTHPVINLLIAKSKGDIFNSDPNKQKPKRILAILNGKNSYESLYNELKSIDPTIEYNQTMHNTLIQLFQGASEITTLGQSLSINGGIKVTLGEPLFFKIKFEDNINKVLKSDPLKGERKFNLTTFVSNPILAEHWIQQYERNKTSYNILAIFRDVPHFNSMLQVPVQFKDIMELLSSDVQRTYRAIDQHFRYNKQLLIDDKLVKKIARVYNDHKIYGFFKTLDFKYKSNNYYDYEGENIVYHENSSPTELNLNTDKGLLTFKTFIENNIIPQVFTKYPNNKFVQNLIFNTQFDSLHLLRIGSYGSKIDLSSKFTQDEISFIKSDWYAIQDDIIEDHSLKEWMFLYDLLVNRHVINKFSISILFDANSYLKNKPLEVLETDPVYKYIKYINDYDNTEYYNWQLKELQSIKEWEIKSNEYEEFDFLSEDPSLFKHTSFIKFHRDPNKMPLFVDVHSYQQQSLLSKNILTRLFSSGKIIVKIC